MGFSTTKVKRDFALWSRWLSGEVDPETNTSWHSWNRAQLAKTRNDRGNQTSHWGNVALSCLCSCAPLVLLTLAAVSRLDVSVTVAPGPLRSPYVLFLVATLVFWAVLAGALSTLNSFRVRSQRANRLVGFWAAVTCGVLLFVYLVVLSRWYAGNGFANLVTIIYAEVNLVLIVHRAATHIATKSPRARAFVDLGYHLSDYVIGYSLLLVLAVLSFTGIVSWLQTLLLFNPLFAKAVRRGQLVRTLGLPPAKDGAGAGSNSDDASSPSAARALTLERAVAAVSVAAQPPAAVPRSRAASVVAHRMQASASKCHLDDALVL